MRTSVQIQDFDAKTEKKAHSPYSASGAERYFECPGSVKLCKPLPDKDTPWSLEGTRAHGVLERIMRAAIEAGITQIDKVFAPKTISYEMIRLGTDAANFILGVYAKEEDSEVLVEDRVYLDFIHPEMFGTFDGAVVDHFGTLHVFDYKFGAGHAVSPVRNLQMIFYGIGLAHKFKWNFKRIRLWIIQPRIKGYDGPLFWEVPTLELRRYVGDFEAAVERVESNPDLLVEGSWCHWCKAKSVCPLKRESKIEQAKQIFSNNPIERTDRGKEESEDEVVFENKSEADWKKAARQKGRKATQGKTKTEKSRRYQSDEERIAEDFKEVLELDEREAAGEFDDFY